MNKKGVFYLFMAVIFVVLFASIFFMYEGYSFTDEQETIAKRAYVLDSFVADLDEDVYRAAFISGFRSLLGVEEYLSQHGTFFTNQSVLEDAFRQVFVNGSYNGTSLTIMDDACFKDYLARVNAQAAHVGITLFVTITNITLAQETPWELSVSFNGSFVVKEQQGLLWWSYNKTFIATIPIEGLKDPLYTVNTLGRVPNTIAQFMLPSDGFVNDTTNDTLILRSFVEDSYYIASSHAPTFLQRFTNDLSPSPHGIESLVYLPALSDQGIIVLHDRSVVDHIYFSSSPDTSNDRCQITNMDYTPDWFRLDNNHLDDYELDGFSSNPCP